MKKLPVGIQSIAKILDDDDYVYIDKTLYAFQLIKAGSPHYFMSRPRRFGKSLFISTLKEIFLGRRELFQACLINKENYHWESHPILHFDFSQISNKSSLTLDEGLKETFEELAQFHNVEISGSSLQTQLRRLIKNITDRYQQRVVVLVDEYDQPIINNLNNLPVAEKNRDLLKDFYGTLKSLDEFIRFTFVTGISKFSQVSLFSGPNYLNDISFDPKYSALLGYTKEELEKAFSLHIETISNKTNTAKEVILSKLKEWYNGYCFSEDCELVYNPFSTLLFFEKGKTDAYWFSSGTPSFLIDQIKNQPKSVISLSGAVALKSALSDISRLDQIDIVALMFQTGYLTIKKYNSEENSFCLDFPNREVRDSFFNSLLKDFAQIDPIHVKRQGKTLQQTLQKSDTKAFVEHINAHFAKIPYQLFIKAQEGFYHAVFLTILEKSGIQTLSEVSTNNGRIDLVAELESLTCIFELKLDKTAQIAINQAEIKDYKKRFSDNGKTILVVGVNFCSKSHQISDCDHKLFSLK